MNGQSTFCDFGAGAGGSMGRAAQWWGGKGIGYEMSKERMLAANERGHDVRYGKLPDVMRDMRDGQFDYAILNHVLEHLPTMAVGRDIVKEACRVSRRFAYIACPWRESDGELFGLGCKLFYNDWPETHPTFVGRLDIRRAMEDGGRVKSYRMYGRQRIEDTSHPFVYSLAQRTEGMKPPYEYDAARDLAKPVLRPLKNCFYELSVLAFIGDEDLATVAGFEQSDPAPVLLATGKFNG